MFTLSATKRPIILHNDHPQTGLFYLMHGKSALQMHEEFALECFEKPPYRS